MKIVGNRGGREVARVSFCGELSLGLAGSVRSTTRLFSPPATSNADILEVNRLWAGIPDHRPLDVEETVSAAQRRINFVNRRDYPGGIAFTADAYRSFNPLAALHIFSFFGNSTSQSDLAKYLVLRGSSVTNCTDDATNRPTEVCVDAVPVSIFRRNFSRTQDFLGEALGKAELGFGIFHLVQNLKKPDHGLFQKLANLRSSGTYVCLQTEPCGNYQQSGPSGLELYDLSGNVDLFVGKAEDITFLLRLPDSADLLAPLQASGINTFVFLGKERIVALDREDKTEPFSRILIPYSSFLDDRINEFYLKMGVMDVLSAALMSGLAEGLGFGTALLLAGCAASLEASRLARLCGITVNDLPGVPYDPRAPFGSLEAATTLYNRALDRAKDLLPPSFPYLETEDPKLMKILRPLPSVH